MYYYNTQYRFSLPEDGPQDVAGGIIAASAMPYHQLKRRKLRKVKFLRHRLFDPQLYLAGLHRGKKVISLSTYPWFACPEDVPEFSTSEHKTLAAWKKEYEDAITKAWSANNSVAPDIGKAAEEAIQFQLDIGCQRIILPSPLTTANNDTYHDEATWLEAGLETCKRRRISMPVYATVAISDPLLRGADPESNGIIHTIADQVTSRSISGIYLVVEQASEGGYTCTHPRTLGAILTLIDDVVRGAGKRVIINFAGAFGAIAMAAGAEIWSAGYYRSQRRLRLADLEETEGRAKPRYFSPYLLGDVGVETDLLAITKRGLAPRVFYNTASSVPLHAALAVGKPTSSVSQWEYRNGNIQAARAHYIQCIKDMDDLLMSVTQRRRVALVQSWLERAAHIADDLKRAGISHSAVTELDHQQTWLEVFQSWRAQAGL